MDADKLIDFLVAEKIITDKARFMAILAEDNFVVSKKMVEAAGYKGEPCFVPIDEKGIFVCCLCSGYCVHGYESCEDCFQRICYECWSDPEGNTCTNRPPPNSDEEESESEEKEEESESEEKEEEAPKRTR